MLNLVVSANKKGGQSYC